MVSIADPRKRTSSAYCQSNACHNPDDKYRVWIVLVVLEYYGHTVNEPPKTRDCTTRMDSTDMLERGSTTKTKPQGGPLSCQNA